MLRRKINFLSTALLAVQFTYSIRIAESVQDPDMVGMDCDQQGDEGATMKV